MELPETELDRVYSPSTVRTLYVSELCPDGVGAPRPAGRRMAHGVRRADWGRVRAGGLAQNKLKVAKPQRTMGRPPANGLALFRWRSAHLGVRTKPSSQPSPKGEGQTLREAWSDGH